MKVPISWLRELVPVEMPLEELAARLAITSCEVDRVVPRGVPREEGNLERFRVGKVLEAGKHPNADRLQHCQVDVGEGQPRSIVCGAWNFGAGATVAVALPGGVLPDGLRLERRKLRGEVSDGMILSERELAIGADHDGIMVLPDALAAGTPLADVLPIVDDVLQIETTFNRPDLLSMVGIAREIAVLYGLPLAPWPGEEPARAGDEPLDIRVDDLEGCPRYIARLFRDVKVGPSPWWLKQRLLAAGMRPISNVVDVTNYVMHLFGSPLHVFDRTTLAEGRIVVRRAAAGEEVRTLDGTRRALDRSDLVIADAGRPVALAAIMGGLDTEVGPETAEVLLEAANFEPLGIMRTSERLGLRTDGSNRWEKGVDPYLAEPAARLATQLIVELAGARWVGAADVHGGLPERPVVRLRPERATHIAGVDVPEEAARATLAGLGFDVSEAWQVTVPTWRARDVRREADVVEEVVRFQLDRVPETLPVRSAMAGHLSRDQRVRRRVEDVLVGLGLSETYTPSLVTDAEAPDGVRLPAPLSADHAVLRTSLLPSLVQAVRNNLDAGSAHAALFEIARAYLPAGEGLPAESWRVAGILDGGFARVKGVVEALHEALHLEAAYVPGEASLLRPGRTARVAAGVLGELHPAVLEGWCAFELDLAPLIEASPEVVRYDDVITFPPVRQDLAFVVPEGVSAGALADAAREAAGHELRSMEAFDVYRGDQVGAGRKSIAFAVAFQSPERTLSDEDAARLRGAIVAALAERFGAELRGA